MLVHVQAPQARRFTMLLRLPDFLNGPLMSHLCAVNNHCAPEQIVRDYLPPDLDAVADDAELTQAFGEACLMAVQSYPGNADACEFLEVCDLQVEPQDLDAFKAAFLAPQLMPLPAA